MARVGVEIWAGGVWLAVTGVALLLPLAVSLDPVALSSALAEVVLLGPLAVWLASLAARALAAGEWLTWRGVVSAAHPATFFTYVAVAVLISACFMAGFVRGFVSLALFL